MKSMKKSFVSAVFAVLVVFALAVLASGVFVENSGFENAQLESRLVNERFSDAQNFVTGIVEDATLDAVYASACKNSGNDFH